MITDQRVGVDDPELAHAAEAVATSDLAMARMTAREQAEAAWTPTAPFMPGGASSVDDLEDEIRADRGLPPLDRTSEVAS